MTSWLRGTEAIVTWLWVVPGCGLLTAFFESADLATPAAIGSSGGLGGRAVGALHATGFDFCGRRLGRHVVVQGARLGLLDVLIDRDADDDVLVASEAAADANAITFPDRPVGLGPVAIDFHFAAFARALGLGSRLEETGNIQPHVEADRLLDSVVHASDQDFDLALRFQSIHERLGLLLAIEPLEILLDLGPDLFERDRAALFLLSNLDDVKPEIGFH